MSIISKIIDKIIKMSLPNILDSYTFCFKRSSYTKRFTFAILIISVLISLYFILFINSYYLKWWIPLFMGAILLLGVISTPIAICYDNKRFEIHGLIEVTRIRMSSIEHIYSLNSEYFMVFIIPIISTFGFMGFTGRYYDIRNKRWVKVIATEYKNLIMIECIGRKYYVISATDRVNIINEISKHVHQNKLEIKHILEQTKISN